MGRGSPASRVHVRAGCGRSNGWVNEQRTYNDAGRLRFGMTTPQQPDQGRHTRSTGGRSAKCAGRVLAHDARHRGARVRLRMVASTCSIAAGGPARPRSWEAWTSWRRSPLDVADRTRAIVAARNFHNPSGSPKPAMTIDESQRRSSSSSGIRRRLETRQDSEPWLSLRPRIDRFEEAFTIIEPSC